MYIEKVDRDPMVGFGETGQSFASFWFAGHTTRAPQFADETLD
jgi:hypothetical protein